MGKPYVYHRADDLGIPVVDSKEKIFVAVIDHDVINAKKANSKHCALARAALRLPHVTAAYFFRQTAFLEYDDKIVKFELPISVQKEIVSFDRAQIFASGVYQLSPPSPSRSAKKRKEYQEKTKRRTPVASTSRTKKESSSLKEAIRTIAESDPKNDTPEQRSFDRRMNNLTTGVTTPKAPAPLMPSGKFIRRTQYVRDLHEPK